MARAQAVLLTKTENLGSEQIDILIQKIRRVYTGPLFQSQMQLSFPEDLDPGTAKILAVSGIAKPDSFEKALRQRYQNIEFKFFPDHHIYSSEDLAELNELSQNFDVLLTTEKDLVKLSGSFLTARIEAVALNLKLTSGEQEFYALLDSLSH